MFVRTLLLAATVLAPVALTAQSWIAPTADELKMTSIPEVPGAAAVVLNRDETADDDNHMSSFYFRIKILTLKGVDLGDVRINFNRRTDGTGYSVSEVAGRTIQPDGTIVPFSGKPFDKLIAKDKENAFTAKVFSMPAVQVGSILEYRYKVRWEDHIFYSPDWFIQTDLYLQQGHFLWKPTDKILTGSSRGHESTASSLTFSKALPADQDLKFTRMANGRFTYEVNLKNIAPFGVEEFMPPVKSSAYHVFFYYTPYRNTKEFWETEGKYWNGEANKFIGNSGIVRYAAVAATTGAASDEDKVHKLYALVMTFENTDYTRTRTTAEEKDETKSAEDVVKRKRGSSNQIARTFVALNRAAGLKASVMVEADRGERLFDATWENFNGQLTDEIAIVNYSGVDHYLDPGSRYCPFGHLEWGHTLSAGVRQVDKDSPIAQSPAEPYSFSKTTRVADLKLDAEGRMVGTVTMTYTGSPALQWRHVALRSDETELRDKMKKQIEGLMPGGTDVTIKTIAGLTDGDTPLKVIAAVDGHVGTSTGSRVVLPGDIFEANSKPTFPHEKRDQGVYFPYSQMGQDAVRFTLPAGYAIESVPGKDLLKFRDLAVYTQDATQTPNTVTIRRDLLMGDLYFPLKDYAELRTFYNDFEHKDHASIVIKRLSDKAELQLPVTH